MTGACLLLLMETSGHSQQESMWSPLWFNLYIRHLSAQVLHCDLLQYTDDVSLIKVVPSKDNRTIAADEMNTGLWGRMWTINFEPAKVSLALCVP